MNDCAIVIAPHWDKGGSNNIFAAQCEYYRRKGWAVALILVPEFKRRRDRHIEFKSELPADWVATLYLGPAVRRARFILSKDILGNDADDFLHRNFMSRAGRLDRGALAYLRSKTIGEICVNWCDNMDVAIGLRRRLGQDGAKIILHTHDILAEQSRVNRTSGERRRKLELAWAAKASHIVHVSDSDARYFADNLGAPQTVSYITLHPENEKKLSRFVHRPDRSMILYVGSWNSINPPSIDWFFRQVVPFVTPAAQLCIVGNICRYIERDLGDAYRLRPNVHLLGRVEDIAEFYERAAVVAIPTVGGTGASVKFIEALAMGVPLVMTSQAIRGLPAEVGDILAPFVADRPIAFAEKLNSALSRPQADVDLRRVYLTHFSNESFFRRLAAASDAAQRNV
jgi:glycosyltransferase involved in cell wall biosynthesis